MRHVRSCFAHALRTTGELLSWHPSPELRFLAQTAAALVGDEGVRLSVRTTARVYQARFTAWRGRPRG
ncbi:hypothetical protein [Streptomyces roseolilacinus]|uniref:hypothetical protein n=1 Tax=Streptomyces roseolilacinus TaxID=66904 RepID=UPI00380B1CB3